MVGDNGYYFDIVKEVANSSTCIRRKVGAIAIDSEGNIIARGYNGVPNGIVSCIDIGECLRDKLAIVSGERHELCRGLHAEQRVIIQCAEEGISLKDSILYCNYLPCSICAKMIIGAGIMKVYYLEEYSDNVGKQYLSDAGIECINYKC